MSARYTCLFLAAALIAPQTFGQGFVNLDFEDATIAPTPVGGWTFPADPAQAFPGWTVGGSNTVVMYNTISLGGPAAILMGPEFPNGARITALQGLYSAGLYYFSAYGVPTLSQTALVPADAKSITFLVQAEQTRAVVTLNAVGIPLIPVSEGRLAGDVTGFAGTLAQLTISVPDVPGYPGQWFYFDDVQFSSSPIPEPSTRNLIVVAAPFLGYRLGRPKRVGGGF